MKHIRELFRLTSPEQRVVVIVVLALIAIAIVQKHRQLNTFTQAAQPTATPTIAAEASR